MLPFDASAWATIPMDRYHRLIQREQDANELGPLIELLHIPKDTLIKDLDITPKRAINAMLQNGIRTVDDLIVYLVGCRPKSAEEYLRCIGNIKGTGLHGAKDFLDALHRITHS